MLINDYEGRFGELRTPPFAAGSCFRVGKSPLPALDGTRTPGLAAEQVPHTNNSSLGSAAPRGRSLEPAQTGGTGAAPANNGSWRDSKPPIPPAPGDSPGSGIGERGHSPGTGGVGAAGAGPEGPSRPQGAAPSPQPPGAGAAAPQEQRPVPAALPASPPRCHLPPWLRRVAVRRPPRAARRSHGGPGGAAAFGRCGEREQRRPRARERGAARPASPPAPSSPRAAPRPALPPLRPVGLRDPPAPPRRDTGASPAHGAGRGAGGAPRGRGLSGGGAAGPLSGPGIPQSPERARGLVSPPSPVTRGCPGRRGPSWTTSPVVPRAAR